MRSIFEENENIMQIGINIFRAKITQEAYDLLLQKDKEKCYDSKNDAIETRCKFTKHKL